MLGLSRDVWRSAREMCLRAVVSLVAHAPEVMLRRAVQPLLERHVDMPEGRRFLWKLLQELRRAWPRLHPEVRRRFVLNVLGNVFLFSEDKHARVTERLGDWPSIMVISPTMRCNLVCEGCYSAHYGRQDAITPEVFHRLLGECEELGIYFVVVSGGEPFIRHDLLDQFAAHPDIQFLVYTNGTLIAQQDLAPRLARLGNVIPCISVEGFEQETDRRRGTGVHEKVMQAMRRLCDEGCIFGFSATPMRHNNDLLASDELVDHYVEKGCFIGFYFSYMPVGRAPDLSLMPTPAQRLHRLQRIRQMRDTKHIVAADFWCDGELTGGCLSGGRVYFHVNAAGGVEPCVFNQFSVDSILDKRLIDVLDSPYFRHIRAELGRIDNPLRPCPIIDRPDVLRAAVTRFEARPQQAGAEAILTGELARGLDDYAAELKDVMDREFEKRRDEFRWSRVQRGQQNRPV